MLAQGGGKEEGPACPLPCDLWEGFSCCSGCSVGSSHPGTEATWKDCLRCWDQFLTKSTRFYPAHTLRSAGPGVLQLRSEGG